MPSLHTLILLSNIEVQLRFNSEFPGLQMVILSRDFHHELVGWMGGTVMKALGVGWGELGVEQSSEGTVCHTWPHTHCPGTAPSAQLRVPAWRRQTPHMNNMLRAQFVHFAVHLEPLPHT